MRTPRFLARLALATALLGALDACIDATGPRPVTGRFTMRDLDGEPLPGRLVRYHTDAGPDGPGELIERWIVASTLVMRARGLDSMVTTYRDVHTPTGGTPREIVYDSVKAYRYDDSACPIDFRSNARPAACPATTTRKLGDSLVTNLLTYETGPLYHRAIFVREGR